MLIHHGLPLGLGQHVPAPRFDERIDEQVPGIAWPDDEPRGLVRVLGELIDRPAGHGEIAVGQGQISAEIRPVQGRLEGHERIEILGHLPQQEIAITADAYETVGPQQQLPVKPLDGLAEFDLGVRLSFRRQSAPRGVELIEGETDNLASLGHRNKVTMETAQGHARPAGLGVGL